MEGEIFWRQAEDLPREPMVESKGDCVKTSLPGLSPVHHGVALQLVRVHLEQQVLVQTASSLFPNWHVSGCHFQQVSASNKQCGDIQASSSSSWDIVDIIDGVWLTI